MVKPQDGVVQAEGSSNDLLPRRRVTDCGPSAPASKGPDRLRSEGACFGCTKHRSGGARIVNPAIARRGCRDQACEDDTKNQSIAAGVCAPARGRWHKAAPQEASYHL